MARGSFLLTLVGLAAVFTGSTLMVANASSDGADKFAGMPTPEAMDAPKVVPASQVSFSVGKTRVRIAGQRRAYQIDEQTGRITDVRLMHFGVKVFRASDRLRSFGGREYVRISGGHWAGWWIKAPDAAPVMTETPASGQVQLSAGVHNGFRFFARGNVRTRQPINLETAATFTITRGAIVNGRRYYLVSDGPLAGRWISSTQAGLGSEPAPPDAPPQQPAPSATPGATWKGVVLIYPGTDVTYTKEDGTAYHMRSQVSRGMHDLVLDTVARFGRSVKNWSGGSVQMTLDIVEVPHDITQLDTLGSRYWVGPKSVREDINRYAPEGSYDSIFVVWPARDENERIPVGGWGLTLPPGSYANGAGYSSIITPSEEWWWTDAANPEEVFVHEWMHQVLFWQEQQGRLTLDLHAGANYGYQSVNGTWKKWLSDVMSGKVADGSHFTGVTREMWATNQPTNR